MTQMTSKSLSVDLRSLVPAVLYGGYGLKMAHDLANELTTLSALKLSIERSESDGRKDWAARAVNVLDMVTESLSSRVRGFYKLRERFDGASASLSGEEFIRVMALRMESLGWKVEQMTPMPPQVVCHWGLLSVCVAALQDQVQQPRAATLSLLPNALTRGRPMLALGLGCLNASAPTEDKDELIAAVQQLLRTMGGVLVIDSSDVGPQLRILLSQTP